MAKRRKADGHDVALTNGLLADIRDLLKGTNERLDRVERDVSALRQEMAGLRGDVEKLAQRVDHILTGPIGQMVREHGASIEELRSRVAFLERGEPAGG